MQGSGLDWDDKHYSGWAGLAQGEHQRGDGLEQTSLSPVEFSSFEPLLALYAKGGGERT